MRLILTVFFLLLSIPAGAIQGGEPALEGSILARSTVALQFQMGDKGEWWDHCTAVIWDDDLIITAAHCVPESPAHQPPLRIAFTSNTSAAYFESRPVVKFIRQEGFQDRVLHETDDHDLAVVLITGGIPPGFQKARLPGAADQVPAAGTPMMIGGFGSVGYDQYAMDVLRGTTVTVSKSLIGQTEILLDDRAHGGSCPGDSGGPAYLEGNGEMILWGITSRPWPLRIHDCQQYTIYTRLDTQLEWLLKAAAQLRTTFVF